MSKYKIGTLVRIDKNCTASYEMVDATDVYDTAIYMLKDGAILFLASEFELIHANN